MPSRVMRDDRLALRDALRYGALGAPLAFVALPLYVHWPAMAAPAMGLSLAALGGLLLVVRCLDAFVDPWLGRRADALLAQGGLRAAAALALGCTALVTGFAALFVAPSQAALPLVPASPEGWAAWSVVALAITYVGYSFVSIAHQAWGARLGGSEAFRARVAASRESFALIGVVAASVLPMFVGWGVVTAVLIVCLVLGVVLLLRAPTAAHVASNARRGVHGVYGDHGARGGLVHLHAPLRHAEFRSLLLVHALSGLAGAIPATLVLFFVRDRLELPGYEGLFLLAYFAAAALSVAAWTRVVERIGLVPVWASGMVLAIAVFAFAAWLGPGDAVGYALVCIGSGAALGAKLVAPAALLVGAIGRTDGALQDEGLWFGWWNLCSKLSLALAAGLALPLVQALGYRPGDASSVGGLVIVYALVPCVLEALALLALLLQRAHHAAPGASSTKAGAPS